MPPCLSWLSEILELREGLIIWVAKKKIGVYKSFHNSTWLLIFCYDNIMILPHTKLLLGVNLLKPTPDGQTWIIIFRKDIIILYSQNNWLQSNIRLLLSDLKRAFMVNKASLIDQVSRLCNRVKWNRSSQFIYKKYVDR